MLTPSRGLCHQNVDLGHLLKRIIFSTVLFLVSPQWTRTCSVHPHSVSPSHLLPPSQDLSSSLKRKTSMEPELLVKYFHAGFEIRLYMGLLN